MSSLWTPEGEHRVRPSAASDPEPAPAAPPRRDQRTDPSGATGFEDLGPQEQAELAGRLDELRQQLLDTPAEVVVANHAYGLFELAAIHLSERPPRLDEARLAVDAMGAIVEALPGRLGEAEQPLRDALAQLRLAYVQLGAATDESGGSDGDGAGGRADASGGAATTSDDGD